MLLDDLLNTSATPQNASPNLGMLGLAMMQASQNGGNFGSLLPLLTAMNKKKQDTNTTDMTSPSPGMDNNSLPTDKSSMLQTLKQQAAAAYPDNPVMQQVAITQAIEESNLLNNPSRLASQNNNLFGIKAPGTAGTVNMQTTEYNNGAPSMMNANFGRNNSIADSFMQHRNLMSNDRYAPVTNSATPTDAFNALQRAGYATDPRYARKLNHIYSTYVEPLYQS